MALFKKDKEEKKENATKSEKDAQSNKDTKSVAPKNARLSDIIISPRITEKSVQLMDKRAYTFNVRKDANKTEIAKAIKEIYGVEPVKVNIINSPSKKKFDYKSGKAGKRSAFKKAIVYLKEGDKISII